MNDKILSDLYDLWSFRMSDLWFILLKWMLKVDPYLCMHMDEYNKIFIKGFVIIKKGENVRFSLFYFDDNKKRIEYNKIY